MSWQAVARVLKGDKVSALIIGLHGAENELATALTNLADAQKTDHEIFHIARDLSGWSREHVAVLAETGRHYDLSLPAEPQGPSIDESSISQKAKRKGAEVIRRFHEPSVLLIAELRDVHLLAAGVSVDWEVLAQCAQAMHDRELLGLAQECHPQTLRQLRWANAKIKELAPQALVGG
jgi:hypothetical protein